MQVCYELFSDDACREYWDDESETPWASCGNDFFTYYNARSLQLKVGSLVKSFKAIFD